VRALRRFTQDSLNREPASRRGRVPRAATAATGAKPMS
jgi:hypothetical protein